MKKQDATGLLTDGKRSHTVFAQHILQIGWENLDGEHMEGNRRYNLSSKKYSAFQKSSRFLLYTNGLSSSLETRSCKLEHRKFRAQNTKSKKPVPSAVIFCGTRDSKPGHHSFHTTNTHSKSVKQQKRQGKLTSFKVVSENYYRIGLAALK